MTDDETDRPDTHYGDLREVRASLIDEHRQLKAYRNQEGDPQNVGERYVEGKEHGTLEAIKRVEQVLTQWIEADDRDGESRD